MDSLPINILLVDDNNFFRKVLKNYLNNMGNINIAGEATNGEEAIEIYRRKKIDLILMDLNMPVLGGVEATRILIEQHENFVKIIGLSQHNEIDYMKRMIQAGASGYVLKEEMGEHLINAITTVLKGEKYFSELIK